MPARILIVDDSPSVRRLLSLYLKGEDYELIEAVNGREAVRRCRKQRPDLVLSDIQMPEMDGYQLCRRLQQERQTRDIPVIFISARKNAADKVKGLELGAVDYITKPFDRGEVLARIRNQLKIRELTLALLEVNRDLRRKQKHLDEDLQAAGQIQKSLLPEGLPEIPELEFAWRFFPCEQVGGDVFNIHPLDENHVALFVLDVSGHGVPSAMVTVSVCQTLLPRTGSALKQPVADPPYYRIISPSEVLSRLDGEYPFERFEKYFTMVYLVVNVRDGSVRYSRAGHPMPVVIRRRGGTELLEAGGPVIGVGGGMAFEEGRVTLAPGDRLFLFTDGITEYRHAKGETFGERRFFRELQHSRQSPLDAACQRVIRSMEVFGDGFRPQDDVTLLAMAYRGGDKR